jgi:asparagine synthase (glutamine-hydrolysing)
MKLGVLFSGGKDSTLAALLAKNAGYEIRCLISIHSKNPHSYMFHTPSISKTIKQAEAMNLPLVIKETEGNKEHELKDLQSSIEKAVAQFGIEGIVTGAVESVYQASRIQLICKKLGIECFNPLWQKDQNEILHDLIHKGFKVIIVGVFAYPLDQKWLGRPIDKKFIQDMEGLQGKFKINPAGEGGEFESFVLHAPGLFKKRLKVKSFRDIKEGENSWRREIEF